MRRLESALVGLACAVTLAGCGSVPGQADAPVAQEALPDVPAAWNVDASPEAVASGWAATFDDPVLLALIEEALAANPDLANAATRVDQARALARQAGAAAVPNVGLSTGGARSESFADGASSNDSFSAGLQASWELDLWGRIRSGISQAEASAGAAAADYRFARASLAANTAAAYFVAIEAQLQTRVGEQAVELLGQTREVIAAREREGMASAQDLALVNSDLAAAEDQLVALEGATRDALRALELLLGRYPGAELTVREQLPEAPPSPPAGLPADLLERRPDLVAAERRVAAAFGALSQARAARLPTIQLTADLGGASSDLSNLLRPGNTAWSVGTGLLAPIFDGGRLRENVNIANAEQEAALAQYASAALQAFGDVETTLDSGRILADRKLALQRSADEARRAYTLAELQYREGETSLIDLISVQQRVITAESAVYSVDRRLLDQRVRLQLALGGSWR